MIEPPAVLGREGMKISKRKFIKIFNQQNDMIYKLILEVSKLKVQSKLENKEEG